MFFFSLGPIVCPQIGHLLHIPMGLTLQYCNVLWRFCFFIPWWTPWNRSRPYCCGTVCGLLYLSIGPCLWLTLLALFFYSLPYCGSDLPICPQSLEEMWDAELGSFFNSFIQVFQTMNDKWITFDNGYIVSLSFSLFLSFIRYHFYSMWNVHKKDNINKFTKNWNRSIFFNFFNILSNIWSCFATITWYPAFSGNHSGDILWQFIQLTYQFVSLINFSSYN